MRITEFIKNLRTFLLYDSEHWLWTTQSWLSEFTTLHFVCLILDVDECLDDTKCDKNTEICENSEGSYECSCKPGYRRKKNGKCLKMKGNKNVNGKRKNKKFSDSSDDPIAMLLKENKLLSEKHLKIGTVLYTCLFTALYVMCRKQSWLGIGALLVLFVACLVFLNRSYPTVDHISNLKPKIP